MARPLFNEIVTVVIDHDPFFRSNMDCAGRQGISGLLKCTSAIRQLAYGVHADFLDEYMQISERTSRTALDHFCQAVMHFYGPEFLRKPTVTDIEKLYRHHEEKHGFPGMLGSLDCTDWECFWNHCNNRHRSISMLYKQESHSKTNSNKFSRVRWIKFADAVTGTGVKINIEHIEGKHNTVADSLSRLVNLCFVECTGEMKELAVAALCSMEEVLQSPNAFQNNMKTTCEEVMKISNHFLESSQKLSSHLKNQEHYTNVTSSRPIKPQSEWINLMHGDQSPKTLNFQQQKKQLKPCETYKQSYNAKPKYALDNQPKTTTDWDAITSNHPEDDAIKDDGKYRYNRKGFLEDDESSDDSILIVDPGWDDYCLQELKLNRPVPFFPEARRALALKNYKSISEKQKELESRVQNCQEKLESCKELLRKTQSETRKSLQQISTEIQQSKPLTKREVLNLVQEIAEQPNQETHHWMNLANQKATTEYQEAIQATEDLESPAVGFAKTSDYKGGLAVQVNVVIKQNNTLLYLATKQSQKLVELEEKFDKLKQEIHTIIEKEVQPADLEDSISSLAKRLDNFSISGKLPVKRIDGKIHVFEDPNKIFKEQHQVARTTRRVFGRNNYNRTLETTVDPERQLEISRERRANLVPAEVLYSNNRSTARHRVYEHYSEQRILCVGENQINLRLCNEESYESLRNSGLQHIHLGIFMIRLHALHRRSAGTNALVVLRDTRWEDSRQIIATMEVDLSAGTQLVYTFPDMILSVNDFHNHVEVAIQTHGYDTWQGGESNLLITMALTGRLSNTSYMGFQYSVENVVDHLTTTGITAIPGERRSIEELEGITRILEEEPLNKVKRSNKPKRSRQRSWERWSTLAEPSGKWDYYVRYDAPPDTTPIEEIAATESSDWDDDERNGGKVLVIQERLAQNQQEFLDEYLPQWDEHLAIQKQELEPDYQFGYPQGKSKISSGGYGEYYNSQWTLPLESITINRLNNKTWSDNKAKLAFVENLLGQSEKLMWQQWRTVFPEAYSALEAIADEPQNITSQVRQLILLENPYHGSIDEQDRAYRDLDRITCEETKNLWSFLEDFRQLATKSGRLYFPSTTEKLFAKLPPSLSKRIKESFRMKHPGLNSGVLPAIKFTHTFVSKMCKDAALAKELRDLSICSAIPIPGYYKNNRKKYGIRKSRTYKGNPHNSHVKPFKIKYKDDRGRVKKCKYFICGKERHFAKDCRSKQGNIAKSAVYQELDLDDNWDIISADFDDSSVYSISK
ncbi:Orf y [Tanacetum coccineum]|uniref:TPA: Orf y n=1 Tax=Tanacetum coccineum TaxID=301880 RepID=A0ABQ5HL37_9ASTR